MSALNGGNDVMHNPQVMRIFVAKKQDIANFQQLGNDFLLRTKMQCHK